MQNPLFWDITKGESWADISKTIWEDSLPSKEESSKQKEESSKQKEESSKQKEESSKQKEDSSKQKEESSKQKEDSSLPKEESSKKEKKTKKVQFALENKIYRYHWVGPVDGFQTGKEHQQAIYETYFYYK